jgi:hypothetical protein
MLKIYAEHRLLKSITARILLPFAALPSSTSAELFKFSTLIYSLKWVDGGSKVAQVVCAGDGGTRKPFFVFLQPDFFVHPDFFKRIISWLGVLVESVIIERR